MHDQHVLRKTSTAIRRKSGTLATLYGCYLILTIGVVSCKDLTGNPGLPAGTSDPSVYNTKAGALGMRNQAVLFFGEEVAHYSIDAGLLTDELGFNQKNLVNAGPVINDMDERILPEGSNASTDELYSSLQKSRGYITQAIGQLAAYDTAAVDTTSAKVLRAELYAFAGYTELLLADLFCSGVPLSTLDFQQDFTYHPSSTTAGVDSSAIFKFDTALTLLASGNDLHVLNLVRVGKGRAWLNIGQIDSAVVAVASVPDTFTYNLSLNLLVQRVGSYTVSDHEGVNGLPYRSSGDPRTADTAVVASDNGVFYFPTKYSASLNASAFAPFMLASGIEARLIQAEVALRQNDATTWLAILNHLRATAPIPGTTQPAPGLLPPLIDPINPRARIDTLFTERAAWLFMTGTRQGDLRRLIRQYGRRQDEVYPTGIYGTAGTGRYGTDVNAPIPSAEAANPLFHGCLDRNA